MNLLTRDEFRTQVFARDNHLCVMCGSPAQDAHHILERRLFEGGGYYLDNGASLCGDCHIKAEQTIEGYMPTDIREAAKIQKVVLPDQLYPDYEYDKWGNVVNPNGTRLRGELLWDESVQKILKEGKVWNRFLPYVKYPRTYHLPFSPGATSDDKKWQTCRTFEDNYVVATIKMDGENTTGYWDGYIHARSLDSPNHSSRNWVKNYLASKLHELPEGWRICGENLYAQHSIHYNNLGSYFHLFSIWNEKNECLSWPETIEWAKLLDLHLVPILYEGPWDEEKFRTLYKPTYANNPCEGFVVRIINGFKYFQFKYYVAKYVRAEHVQTNQHWIRTAITKNEL